MILSYEQQCKQNEKKISASRCSIVLGWFKNKYVKTMNFNFQIVTGKNLGD